MRPPQHARPPREHLQGQRVAGVGALAGHGQPVQPQKTASDVRRGAGRGAVPRACQPLRVAGVVQGRPAASQGALHPTQCQKPSTRTAGGRSGCTGSAVATPRNRARSRHWAKPWPLPSPSGSPNQAEWEVWCEEGTCPPNAPSNSTHGAPTKTAGDRGGRTGRAVASSRRRASVCRVAKHWPSLLDGVAGVVQGRDAAAQCAIQPTAHPRGWRLAGWGHWLGTQTSPKKEVPAVRASARAHRRPRLRASGSGAESSSTASGLRPPARSHCTGHRPVHFPLAVARERRFCFNVRHNTTCLLITRKKPN